ncbi:monofunctional biosynthetic peptidoglycan transglycosylase [Rhodococcus sp. 27YEA15]|uniref:transglycosylase domain-containing protein n=1 Tax=Rhodococcus sp. 27YEA15 TaxID=3156259 RepID=UPI003C7BC83C
MTRNDAPKPDSGGPGYPAFPRPTWEGRSRPADQTAAPPYTPDLDDRTPAPPPKPVPRKPRPHKPRPKHDEPRREESTRQGPSFLRRWAKRAALALVAVLATVELIAILLVFVTPPRTMFMATDSAPGPIVQQNVSIDHISRYMISSAIVHEDGQLGTRSAPFDYGEFMDRIEARLRGNKDPAGSSIPQQVTKNIFFNRSQNSVKKGVEALFSIPFGYTISDKRMMEIYLNIAQFGPNLYGVCAASWYYFGVPPWNINEYQAAQLAGTLPLGEEVRRAPGGGIDLSENAFWLVPISVNRAAEWFVPEITREMGGWEGVVATIDIHEPASAFADRQGERNACSTMPQGVADRLAAEGNPQS